MKVSSAHGLSNPVGPHLSLVDAAGDAIKIGATFAKMLLQEGKSFRFQIDPGFDPVFVQALGGRRPNTVEFIDGQGFDKDLPDRRACTNR